MKTNDNKLIETHLKNSKDNNKNIKLAIKCFSKVIKQYGMIFNDNEKIYDINVNSSFVIDINNKNVFEITKNGNTLDIKCSTYKQQQNELSKKIGIEHIIDDIISVSLKDNIKLYLLSSIEKEIYNFLNNLIDKSNYEKDISPDNFGINNDTIVKYMKLYKFFYLKQGNENNLIINEKTKFTLELKLELKTLIDKLNEQFVNDYIAENIVNGNLNYSKMIIYECIENIVSFLKLKHVKDEKDINKLEILNKIIEKKNKENIKQNQKYLKYYLNKYKKYKKKYTSLKNKNELVKINK